MRSRNWKRKRKLPVFGEAGRTDVAITNIELLPCQVRGDVTGTLYVWPAERTKALWIDVRDLPTVVKNLESVGVVLNDLSGTKIDERKRELAAAEREQRKAEREQQKKLKEETREKSEEVE